MIDLVKIMRNGIIARINVALRTNNSDLSYLGDFSFSRNKLLGLFAKQ